MEAVWLSASVQNTLRTTRRERLTTTVFLLLCFHNWSVWFLQWCAVNTQNLSWQPDSHRNLYELMMMSSLSPSLYWQLFFGLKAFFKCRISFLWGKYNLYVQFIMNDVQLIWLERCSQLEMQIMYVFILWCWSAGKSPCKHAPAGSQNSLLEAQKGKKRYEQFVAWAGLCGAHMGFCVGKPIVG